MVESGTGEGAVEVVRSIRFWTVKGIHRDVCVPHGPPVSSLDKSIGKSEGWVHGTVSVSSKPIARDSHSTTKIYISRKKL